MRRWAAYVSLSSDEGQGLAVLEAMAAGVPVVALAVAGIEDYLTHERTGLAARATLMHVDRARAMVQRRYAWARTVAQIDEIYRRLSSG